MKKTIFVFLLTALMLAMTSMPAFAHGHGRSYRTVQQPRKVTYAVCAIDSCEIYGVHEHNGTYYNCAPHSETHRHGYGHR